MNTHSSATFVSHRNEYCNSMAFFRIPKILILGIFTIGLESNLVPSYANGVQCKITEFALAGNQFSKGAYSPLRAFFVRKISMHSHVMAELERDTFECAGFLLSLSANPFQLCHPHHLAVIGKASLNSKGAH